MLTFVEEDEEGGEKNHYHKPSLQNELNNIIYTNGGGAYTFNCQHPLDGLCSVMSPMVHSKVRLCDDDASLLSFDLLSRTGATTSEIHILHFATSNPRPNSHVR